MGPQLVKVERTGAPSDKGRLSQGKQGARLGVNFKGKAMPPTSPGKGQECLIRLKFKNSICLHFTNSIFARMDTPSAYKKKA